MSPRKKPDAPGPGAEDAAAAFLGGERVALRGVRRADMEDYRRWLDTAEVTRYLEMGARPTSDRELDEVYRLSTESPNDVVFIVVDKRARRAVGIAGLYAINWPCRRADFRIIIGEPEAFDKGLGTETAKLLVAYGFDTLNLQLVTLGCNAENERAVRSYEKAGFVHEGRRRRLLYCNGKYCDVVQMSILREEYYGRE